jgi:hypothetical protein
MEAVVGSHRILSVVNSVTDMGTLRPRLEGSFNSNGNMYSVGRVVISS